MRNWLTHDVRKLVARVGHIDEWHLVFSKAFPHITLGIPSGFSEKAIVFWSAFSQPGFITVGAISDAVDGDRIEQVPIKDPP